MNSFTKLMRMIELVLETIKRRSGDELRTMVEEYDKVDDKAILGHDKFLHLADASVGGISRKLQLLSTWLRKFSWL